MRINILTTGVLSLVSAIAFAQSEYSVNVESLDIRSKNVIEGNIKATDTSTVLVGDTEITNTEADTIKVDTDNYTKQITADDNSVVSVGNTKISNVKANTIDIESDNVVTGTIKAKDQSTVSVGSTQLQNLNSGGLVKVKTDNAVSGKITATDNSHVKIGTTTTQ